MNKQEIINDISQRAGISKKDATAAMNAFCEAVTGALRRGDKVTLTGFGTFERKIRGARDCKNPATGESVHVGVHKAPSFKAGKALKEALL